MSLKTTQAAAPRLTVAGLAGDTGKSLVALGLVRALARRSLAVAAFKKGPDFIDAAWLSRAAGAPARNLDTFMMATETIHASLWQAASAADVAVVEGNRGLFDGVDAGGTHSTAELAKLIAAPVVLVVDATKVTRTVAAQVLGCRALDRDLPLAGVVLNRVGTARQERVIREAVERDAGVPVLGAIPKLAEQHLPSRHLGLVTAVEHPGAEQAITLVADVVEKHVDVDAVLAVARRAPALSPPASPLGAPPAPKRARIAVLRDRAFSFYYPENLTALEQAGAELVYVSPLADGDLPEVDAVYAGGGFPEVYAAELSANRGMRESIARRVAQGMPVWAECGGLMYLAREIQKDGVSHPMVGALPVTVEHTARPQGHGYVRATVDHPNPFFEPGTTLTGHEFHYSRTRGELTTVMSLERGVGVGGGRDGLAAGNVLASYTHLHALGTPGWADAVVRSAAGRSR